jgi:serine phosphatase RsbU (regulator of sigma subunit)
MQAGLYDFALAVEDRARFTQRKVRANTGDRILLLTDGVLEAPAPDGELFGKQRLEVVLREQAKADQRILANGLLDALQRHVGQPTLTHDDVTFLLIEFVDNVQGSAVWRMIKNRLLRPKGNSQSAIFSPLPAVSD